MNKLTLFLMSKKGADTLKALLQHHSSEIIDFVVLAKDKNVINDYSSEITKLCKKNKIRVFERNDSYSIQSKYAIAISWRWLIPLCQETQLITLHDSLLPKYRGFAPLVNQLINKEPYIGVTAIFSNREFDKGEIIAQAKIEIHYPINIQQAIEKTIPLYQDITLQIAAQIQAGQKIKSTPQKESEATYSLWRDEEDYRINWQNEAQYIKRFIDAVGSPFKGAFSMVDGHKVRLVEAVEEEDVIIENRACGKVLFIKDGCPVVVCAKGLLKLTAIVFDETQESALPLQKFRARFL